MNEKVITLVVELEDKPGQLVKVLEPIAKLGGNIIGIVHQRGKRTPLGKVPVEITFKIDSRKVQDLMESLNRFSIRSFDEIKLLESATIVLVGHIIHTDLSDTIKRIDSKDSECVELTISMPEQSSRSTAMLIIAARNKEALEDAIKRLKNVCKEKKIEVIEPIYEEFL